MTIAVITSKGQIVIPAKIRRNMKINKGAKFSVEERDGELILKPLQSRYFNKIAGILDTKGRLSKMLLNERAIEKIREKR